MIERGASYHIVTGAPDDPDAACYFEELRLAGGCTAPDAIKAIDTFCKAMADDGLWEKLTQIPTVADSEMMAALAKLKSFNKRP